MKNSNTTVFARPNLKAFVLGAISLIVLQHLITEGRSESPSLLKPLAVNARETGDAETRELMRAAVEQENAELFMRLSCVFEKHGDFRRALLFLREAEKLGIGDDLE